MIRMLNGGFYIRVAHKTAFISRVACFFFKSSAKIHKSFIFNALGEIYNKIRSVWCSVTTQQVFATGH